MIMVLLIDVFHILPLLCNILYLIDIYVEKIYNLYLNVCRKSLLPMAGLPNRHSAYCAQASVSTHPGPACGKS